MICVCWKMKMLPLKKLLASSLIKIFEHDFEAISDIFKKINFQMVDGGYKLLKGGYDFDGRELCPIDQNEISETIEEFLTKYGINHFILSGVFSPVKNDQENKAKQYILSRFPLTSVTCSHELGHLGLLERENASILNECLKNLAQNILSELKSAIEINLGLTCPIYLTQNNGTICSIDQAMQFPIFTFASGPTNSMRGAAFISEIKTAIVVDIGGTSTDVGILNEGFPKEANSKIYIGGVPTFFRMPNTYSIGLGGGSIVAQRDGSVTVGPDSVGYRITTDSLCFGGTIMTATDVAVAFGQASNIDSAKIKNLTDSEIGKEALKLIRQKIEMAIDHVKSDQNPIPVVLVGGGSILINIEEPMIGCKEIISMPHAKIANAIGAALCQVSGVVDIVSSIDPNDSESRKMALEGAKRKAIDNAISNGATADSVKIVECMELPLTYLPGNAVQYKIRAVGDLKTLEQSKLSTIDLDEFRKIRKPLVDGDVAKMGKYKPAFSKDAREIDDDLGPIREITRENSPFDENEEWILTRYDIECISIGAGIMGCGGGGSPHAGKIQLLHLLNQGKRPRVVTVDRLLKITPSLEKSVAIGFGAMGAPVCLTEKLQSDQSMQLALATNIDIFENPQKYKELPRQHFDGGVTYSDHVPIPENMTGKISEFCSAVMAFEVGGANSIAPLAASARFGLPCVDVDGMGRAAPELQMYTPFVYGENWNPMVQTNDSGRITINWTADTPKDVENLHRSICIENGCESNLAYSLRPISKLKQVCVQGSISRSWKIGKAVLDARINKTSPIEAVVRNQNGKLLFMAKIIDVERRTEGGFNRGFINFEGLGNPEDHWSIIFQNENLIVKKYEIILATVPDLICILDLDSGDPINTEDVRYGLRIAVVILPPSPLLTSEKALPIFGPKGFGLDLAYKSAC